MADNKKQKSWSELPLEIREILSDTATVDRIEAIGARFGLSVMERGFLVRICANLMKGVIAPPSFISSICEETDATREVATEIAKEINKEIFSQVKEALRTVHERSGNIVRLDPSLITCLPKNMPQGVATQNRAPGNAETGNIMAQKLAGTFRIKEGEMQTSMPQPREVVPPPPVTQMPARAETPAPVPSITPSASDRYREPVA